MASMRTLQKAVHHSKSGSGGEIQNEKYAFETNKKDLEAAIENI